MTTLGNYNHDFPRLAKQSGFIFQLHRAKVNWAQVENIDLNDIIENRNFQLLEENLINVVNCNLEKEFESKILDSNFMKLFKLAQLGVEYLSYCEAYLDKCVIILQEQLLAFQEECKSLKYDKIKRKEEDNRSRKKTKTQSYQCEKCDKIFISDVYLKFHDKRRHSSPNTPKSTDSSVKRCLDNSQQTEDESKTSKCTQTELLLDRATPTTEDSKENTKQEHAEKIDNLEQEIQHLKERLRKAENALTDKIEKSTSSGCHSPMCHNTMLLLLPSQQANSGSNYQEVSPKYLVPAPEMLQSNCSLLKLPIEPKTSENFSHPENISEKTELSQKEEIKLNAVAVEKTEHFKKPKREVKPDFECDKENLDPNTESTAPDINKPLPPPRKPKKSTPAKPKIEMTKPETPTAPPRTQLNSENKTPVVAKSTSIKQASPVKSSSDIFEEFSESLSDVQKRQSTSNDSLNSRKTDITDIQSRSFFQTIKKNSPKLQFLGRSLRRSLTTLCDSVSSTGRDSKDSADPAKSAVVEGLNGELRQLGVDPEWSGIPKKTMKQKLKILKHRRKLLAKENPMYPIIRQNIEEKIFQKLKNKLGSKKSNLIKKLSKESVSIEEGATQEPILKSEPESAKSQRCLMYDIESDSKSLDSEIDFNEQIKPPKELDLDTKPSEKEFDLSVFQVGSANKVVKQDVSVKIENLLSDSDTDGDFPTEKNLKTYEFSRDKREKERLDEDEGHQLGYFFPRQEKPENQSILKSEGFQSKLDLNSKKKVWFGNFSSDLDGLSDSPTDDWSLKSDWEKDLG